MHNNDTDNKNAFWILKYILLRNPRALSSFPNLPEKLKPFAAEQYAIGWREFTEGRISRALINVQREHLNATGGDVSGAGWVLYCTRTDHKLSGPFYEE